MAVRYLAIAIGVVSTMYWLPGSPLAAVLNLLPERVQQLLLIRHGMFFALGVFLWLHLVKREGRNLEWCVLFCVGGCLQIAHQTVEWNIGCNKHYSPLVGCAIWLLSVGAIVASVRFNHLVHRAPQWFLRLMKSAGLMTFPLYLLHEVVGIAAMGALVKHGMNRWPALVVVCAGAILLAWLIATHVEPLAQRLTKSLLLRGHAQWTRIGERLSKLPAGKSS
jgi:peptidoglycan/LPS O-acetylase OafA/YrhL